ncbi:MAG: hypothetical protein WCT18_02200 [Patescibacteria group bacterium]
MGILLEVLGYVFILSIAPLFVILFSFGFPVDSVVVFAISLFFLIRFPPGWVDFGQLKSLVKITIFITILSSAQGIYLLVAGTGSALSMVFSAFLLALIIGLFADWFWAQHKHKATVKALDEVLEKSGAELIITKDSLVSVLANEYWCSACKSFVRLKHEKVGKSDRLFCPCGKTTHYLTNN